MIVYLLLLTVTAAVAYVFGSMSTLVLASNFVFKYNLKRLGRGNDWLSNFRRIYGLKGALELLVVEAIKDCIPIVIGGLLLGIRGYAAEGRAMAGFCMVMGRLWPCFYNLRGSHGIAPMIFTALFADTSLGIVVAAVFIGTMLLKRVPVAAAASALVLAAAPILIVDSKVVMYLMAFTAAAVIVRHIPGLRRVLRKEEELITFREDLSYKFDEKF